MIIRYRNYPNSSKITYKNALLRVVNIILTFVIFMVLAFIFGGPYMELNTGQTRILIVLMLLCFCTLQERINNYTDKQYVQVLEEYTIKIEELTPEKPKELVLEGQEEV